jgi:hypothetical protein
MTNNQNSAKVRERLQDCIPDDPKSCLFTLVAVAYLIVGAIHFFETRDPSMLTPLLYAVAGYAGLSDGKAFLTRGKKGGSDL